MADDHPEFDEDTVVVHVLVPGVLVPVINPEIVEDTEFV